MTPAITHARHCHIWHRIHEYTHDPSTQAYGDEAAEKLGVDGARIFKTLIIQTDKDKLAVAVVPVITTLNLKKMAKALGAKKVELADPKRAERSCGYVTGGISPLGQKKPLTTIIDDSALSADRIYVSAGRRGLEIELSAQDLATCTKARFAAIRD